MTPASPVLKALEAEQQRISPVVSSAPFDRNLWNVKNESPTEKNPVSHIQINRHSVAQIPHTCARKPNEPNLRNFPIV